MNNLDGARKHALPADFQGTTKHRASMTAVYLGRALDEIERLEAMIDKPCPGKHVYLTGGSWQCDLGLGHDGPHHATVSVEPEHNLSWAAIHWEDEPLHVKVKGAPDSCDTCADCGFVPCPTCKPVHHVRRQSDARMRVELRKAATEQVT